MAGRQIRHGTKATLPTLSEGELDLCTNTREVYVGSSVGNIRIHGDYITPEMFGAKGDSDGSPGNGTDDGAAVQEANDYLLDRGHGALLFTRTYRTGRILVPSPKVSWLGQRGHGIALDSGVGASSWLNADDGVDPVIQCTGDCGRFENIGIKSWNGKAIRIHASSHWSFRNVATQGGGATVKSSILLEGDDDGGVYWTMFDNCQTLQCSGHGMEFSALGTIGYINANQFINYRARGCGLDGFHNSSLIAQQNIFLGGGFETEGADGIYDDGIGNMFLGPYIEGNAGYGINLGTNCDAFSCLNCRIGVNALGDINNDSGKILEIAIQKPGYVASYQLSVNRQMSNLFLIAGGLYALSGALTIQAHADNPQILFKGGSSEWGRFYADGRFIANQSARILSVPTCANNAAAVAGGLVSGDLYSVTGTDPLQLARVI